MTVVQKIAVIGILLIGFIIRVYQYGSVPSGFHADEAAFGYNAYSILKTGKDEYGKPFPIILKSFGDYKGSLYAYLTIPFVATMGLSETSVRLPSLVFGILMMVLTFALVRKLTNSPTIAIFALSVEAVSPMPVFLSRVQSEPLVSVFFVFFGFYVFLLWMEKRGNALVGFVFLSWMAAIWTSTIPRLYLLFFMPFTIVWMFKSIPFQKRKMAGALAGLVIVGIGFFLVFASAERFGQVSVFSKKDVILLMEEHIREDGVGNSFMLESRVFHNKIAEFGRYFLHAYFQYMNYEFLFEQVKQPSREIIPNVGALLLIELPFMLFGIYASLKKNLKWGRWATGLFIVTPILLSFASDETPNFHRFYLTALPMSLLVGLGVQECISFIGKRHIPLAITGILIVCSANTWFFLHNLFIHQPVHVPYYRDFAYKGLVNELKRYYPEYDTFVITKDLGSPYIHILFYWPYDPYTYQHMGSPRDMDGTGFDKFVFVPQACPSKEKGYQEKWPGKNILYVDKSECTVDPKEIRSIIRWNTGVPAFIMAIRIPKEGSLVQ